MAELNTNELTALFSENADLKPLFDVVEQIMDLSDEQLNANNLDIMIGMFNGVFTNNLKEQMIEQTVAGFRRDGYTRTNATQQVAESKEGIGELINILKPSQYKRELLEALFNNFYNVFDQALERFMAYDINLPITLDEGAREPTYAHDTDAAADLYAADDMTLPAHSISNMVRTGVHIQLPEGWAALVLPRSSMGMKTGLRLSNSVGLIDSDYRGPIGVIYDNISDSDYKIKAGDRIAQMLVVPSYRFKANVVDKLTETERGEGGFGSSGK